MARHPTLSSDGARSETPQFTFVDLFCGAGGFSEGFILADHTAGHLTPVGASDVNESARLTYERRFVSQLGFDLDYLERDVRDPKLLVELEDTLERKGLNNVDVVCGGPPCQGFAVFGARREADPRNDLFLSYLRAIQILKPAYFIMENVPGFVRMYGGSTVDRMYEATAQLVDPDYTLAGPLLVNAADYGVPQLRERIFFIGSRSDVRPLRTMPPPRADAFQTAGEAIGDLAFLRPWESAGEYHEDWQATSQFQIESREGRAPIRIDRSSLTKTLANHQAAKHSPEVMARFALMRPGEGLESIPAQAWDRHLKTRKKWCMRLKDNRPATTIVTLPDDLVHATQPRILTVRECARLQSFDDTFHFLGPRSTGGGGAGNKKRNLELPQYSQVGNAVPPLLARAIGEHLLEALSGGPDDPLLGESFSEEFGQLVSSNG
jgi:DNA (cytosine-5)-methyltransferase 1